jgi:hypothetical protein
MVELQKILILKVHVLSLCCPSQQMLTWSHRFCWVVCQAELCSSFKFSEDLKQLAEDVL